MNRDERRARQFEIVTELEALARHDRPTHAQALQSRALSAEFDELEKADRAAELARIRSAADGAPGLSIERGAPTGDEPHRGHDRPRSGAAGEARRAIDQAARTGLPDHAAQTATTLVESGTVRDRGVAARWATVAGSPAYASAFAKVVADPERGSMLWDDQERRAFRDVQEFRAASLTDASGGYMVPLTLDPAIMLTSPGSTSVLRQAARTVTIATDKWAGVTSAGVTVHWRAEAGETDDDSPVLGEVSIPVHRADAFIPFSFEIAADAPNFLTEMQRLLVDAALHHETTAFTTGTGTGQPRGLVTALAATPASVVTATGEAITAADTYRMQAALPPRFSPAARWMGNISTMNTLAQLETGNGARVFPEIGSGTLLRKPLDELSTMDGTINPAATETNNVLVYGDLGQGMVIVDRIGTVIELVPHLVGPNRRPTGQRGLLMWRRVGADVVVPEALRMLRVSTTA